MNNVINANKHDAKNDNWVTPKEILSVLGSFELDPCAAEPQPWRTADTMLSIRDDGLKENWDGRRVWLNPPYTKILPWMRCMAENKNGIALIAARTDTIWFQEYVFPFATAILFVKGRVTFCTPDGKQAMILNKKTGKYHVCPAGFPSALVAYSMNDAHILFNAHKSGGLVGKLVWLVR